MPPEKIKDLLGKIDDGYDLSVASRYVPGGGMVIIERSEERRVGKECRSRWSPYH